jgi:hypothetical protein
MPALSTLPSPPTTRASHDSHRRASGFVQPIATANALRVSLISSVRQKTVAKLNTKALWKGCQAVAASTMWVTPRPQGIEDIITTSEIKAVVDAYYESAKREAWLLEEAQEDPNLVLSAINYLAAFHAIPPMRDDHRWFSEALHTLLVLARPSITGADPSDHPFLDEILQGLAESKRKKPGRKKEK